MAGQGGPARDARRFLFLQGPISPFFRDLGAALAARGHAVHRINLNLGDWFMWRGFPKGAPRPEPAVNYRGGAAGWPAFVADHLDRHRISDLVLLGEQRPQHKAAIAAAHARGIAVTVTDFGYLRPDWIVLERDGMNGDSAFPRDPAAIMALARDLPPPDLVLRHRDSFGNQATWDVAYHVAGLVPFVWPHARHGVHHPLLYYTGIGWRLLKRGFENRRADAVMASVSGRGPLFLFAMQMETDYSIRAYSPYRDMDTPIRETVESFARAAPRDAQLLIKVHPLDPGLKKWRWRVGAMARAAGVGDRIHYLGGGNLRDMVERSGGLVTVNSTVGLRAIVDGLPTMVLGDAIYRVPGLVHGGTLDGFWTEGRAPDPVLRDAYLRALAWSVHVRGVFYARPGLDAAVRAAADRLEGGLVNVPVVEGAPAVQGG